MNMNVRTTDFAILGAGVMGTSIAFQLAKRKAGRIVVIEKHAGRGASGRSSARVRIHYTFEPEVQLALRSFEMLRNWQQISGGPGDFHRVGFLQLSYQKKKLICSRPMSKCRRPMASMSS
jgi:glycine/D-amino acid oxidase-like deaminating enzyme